MKHDPAFPIDFNTWQKSEEGHGIAYKGLSKTEYIAALLMQGFIAHEGESTVKYLPNRIQACKEIADALLARLEKS